MISRKLLMMMLLIPIVLFGQETKESIEQLKEEISAIKRNSSELENKIEKLQAQLKKAEKKDEMKNLLERAKNLSQQKKEKKASVEKKFHSGLRQQSALNPNISLGGDYYVAYGSSRSDYNRIPSENSWGTGQFFLREMELGIVAPLDPFSRGKVYISFGREGVTVEEGYMQWLNLPLNMNLKLGEYKTQFGKINRYHDHALPQFERPLVLTNFFGMTTLKGFGVAANFLLPSLVAHVNELDIEVITGGIGQSFTESGKGNLIYIAHLKNYYDLNRATYFEFGLSGALGNNDAQEEYLTKIAGVDLTLKWSPPERAKYMGIEWRSEFIFSKRKQPDKTINSWGFFSYIQCKLNARWLVSGRMDYSQLPYDHSLEEKGFAVCLDYWQTEFVFVRFQYTYIHRNFEENDNRIIFQTCWAMGPHKHEAY